MNVVVGSWMIWWLVGLWRSRGHELGGAAMDLVVGLALVGGGHEFGGVKHG